jgi:inner membrane protein
MSAFFGLSHPALWLVLGLVLIALEALVAPGAYLLWIGLAALMLAGISGLVPLTLMSQLLLFGGLSLVLAVLGWRLVYSKRTGHAMSGDAARDLHDPATSMIGRVIPLHQAIINGAGLIRVDDTIWRVSGPDLPLGASVKVVGLEGTLLLVTPASA